MGAIFQSLGRTVTAGIVLLIVIVIVVSTAVGGAMKFDHAWWAFFMRWLHVLSGVMWIGLLWYFNFVQTPSMPQIPDEQKPAVSKVIAPRALFWFRWAALATVVTGLLLAWMNGYLAQALAFKPPVTAIGIGMWLGLIMAFNVWFIIWPNQKKALGIVQVSPEEKTAAAKMAGMTSRFNTMLSIPDALLHGRAAERRPVDDKGPQRPLLLAAASPESQRGGGALSMPEMDAPALMPLAANQPWFISSANRAGPLAQCDSSVCGCMSAMLRITPRSSMNATESGTKVFFIHMQWRATSGKTNSMPRSVPSDGRCMSPVMRDSLVLAISAWIG